MCQLQDILTKLQKKVRWYKNINSCINYGSVLKFFGL